MKVRDLMTTDVVTVEPDTPFQEVANVLLAADVSGLPVVDPRGRLVGVITEADLLPKEGYGHHRPLGLLEDALLDRELTWLQKAAARTARDVMTAHPITARPDEDIRTAARRMVEAGVKRLPVVHEDVVVGILSRQDILRVFARFDADLEIEIRDLLQHCGFRPPHREVRVTVSDGVATLSGDVERGEETKLLEALAATVHGVVGVRHDLTVRAVPHPARASGQ